MITSTRRSISTENAIYTLHAGMIVLALLLIAMYYMEVTPYLGNFIAGVMITFASIFIGVKYSDELIEPIFNILGISLVFGMSLMLNYLMTTFMIDFVTVLIMLNLMLLYVYFWKTKNKMKIFECKLIEISYWMFGGVLVIFDTVCYLFLNEITFIQIIIDILVYLLIIRLIDKVLIYSDEFRNSAGNVFLAMEKYLTK